MQAPVQAPVQAPRPRDVTPPRTRGPTLAALQESEPWTAHAQSPAVPEKSSYRGSPRQGSPNIGASARSRDSPVAVPVSDRVGKQKAVEGGARVRSASGTGGESPSEKASLQRVSSSASTNRSASTSILNSGRDSDASLNGRPRGISGRMSEEDRQREFDSLVKREETVKYTLTPQNMRDMEVRCTIPANYVILTV